MDREVAVDRVLQMVDCIEEETLPVPLSELWITGDLALGLDPVDRIDIYVSKDVLFVTGETDPETAAQYRAEYGVDGIGTTIRADWAAAYPDRIRTNDHGHAAPERCLAAHLLEEGEPIHLEVCNAGFSQNVTQRLRGAIATERYEEILDPRGVCLWSNGKRSASAPERLRAGNYVFPTLPDSLCMLGLEQETAEKAAAAINQWRKDLDGTTVRGDVR